MYWIAWALIVGATAGGASISGTVILPDGSPAAGAEVFVEPGADAPLLQATADAAGGFRFEEAPAGLAGVFAVATGAAYGGTSITLAPGDAVTGLELRLRAPDEVRGRVVDAQGKAVSGAAIPRIALLGDMKVSIPLDKLAGVGVETPSSGTDGAFAVPRVPDGVPIALKVVHPMYAQEGVPSVEAGAKGVKVTLYPGIVLRGEVRSLQAQTPVANVSVVVKNAQPPHDTATTRTDGAGVFAMRLKPGVYLYQASGPGMRTPNWENLVVRGDTPEVHGTLYVAGVGRLHGQVSDAATEKPVAGARVTLSANNKVAAVVTTGASGAYEFAAAEGENVLILQPPKGYMPPQQNAIRITVAEGADAEAPVFWLAPLPTLEVRVVDDAMNGVTGCVVSVCRPAQFGWLLTDAEGKVRLPVASVPPDGLVVGTVERVDRPEGALFALKAGEPGPANVQLLPLTRVTGRVVDGKGKGVEGAVVGAAFAQESGREDLLFWRTVSRGDGAFSWDSAVPQVPLRCYAISGSAQGASAPFTARADAPVDAGAVALSEGSARGACQVGRKLAWDRNPVVAGSLPDRAERRNRPAVVIYCAASEAAMVAEALSIARGLFPADTLDLAVVSAGPFSGDSHGIPVLTGQAPGPATTYVVDATGAVTLETFGLPPLRAIQAVRGGH